MASTIPSRCERLRKLVEPLAASYLVAARSQNGRPVDPVARFHLGNGARLERLNWLGDRSRKGLNEAAGVMVNYLYRLEDIKKNHEAYANDGEVVASSAVKKLLKGEGREAAGHAAVVASPNAASSSCGDSVCVQLSQRHCEPPGHANARPMTGNDVARYKW